MNWWLWLIVSFCLQMMFGIVVGVLLFLLIYTVYILNQEYDQVKKLKKIKDIQANNVLVSIEAVEHKGAAMLLVYNAVTNKFVLQGNTMDEVVESLKVKFENKNIFVSNGEDSMTPLYLMPDSE